MSKIFITSGGKPPLTINNTLSVLDTPLSFKIKYAVRTVIWYMFSHVFNFSADEIILILNSPDRTYQLTNNSVHGTEELYHFWRE